MRAVRSRECTVRAYCFVIARRHRAQHKSVGRWHCLILSPDYFARKPGPAIHLNIGALARATICTRAQKCRVQQCEHIHTRIACAPAHPKIDRGLPRIRADRDTSRAASPAPGSRPKSNRIDCLRIVRAPVVVAMRTRIYRVCTCALCLNENACARTPKIETSACVHSHREQLLLCAPNQPPPMVDDDDGGGT